MGWLAAVCRATRWPAVMAAGQLAAPPAGPPSWPRDSLPRHPLAPRHGRGTVCRATRWPPVMAAGQLAAPPAGPPPWPRGSSPRQTRPARRHGRGTSAASRSGQERDREARGVQPVRALLRRGVGGRRRRSRACCRRSLQVGRAVEVADTEVGEVVRDRRRVVEVVSWTRYVARGSTKTSQPTAEAGARATPRNGRPCRAVRARTEKFACPRAGASPTRAQGRENRGPSARWYGTCLSLGACIQLTTREGRT
jgi:hypothetical protein